MKLSDLANGMAVSAAREMFDLMRAMTDTVNFTLGEPDFVTPRPVIDAACDAWREGRTFYTPNCGVAGLRQAIADYHKGGLAPDPETQIIVTCGATEALQTALFTVANPGDEVILITPAWPNFYGQIRMCGAIPKIVPAREQNDFMPDPDDIKNALTAKTRAIIINSPSNPTGAVVDRDTYGRIVEILRERDIFIIADEVYSRLIYGTEHISISEFPEVWDKTIYINSFSKMLAMTGWRLGYAIAAPGVVANMAKLHEYGASCLPEPSQLAAAHALYTQDAEIERMRAAYERRRDLICDEISKISGMSCRAPKGAFYLFPNITGTGLNSRDFCMELLRATGVAAVPGSGFGEGGEGYIRMCYATSEENIREGMLRMRRFMEGL